MSGPTREEILEALIKSKEVKSRLAREELRGDLFKFNKFVLHVEEGQGKVPLAPFHKELCLFVEKDKHKKKLILIPRGHLKALKTENTKILTPYGFVSYKDLKVGDEIIGGNGKPTKVVKIHPKQKIELYKVMTNDGREIVCNLEHRFKVQVRANTKRWKVRKLKWIFERYSKERVDKRDGKIRYEHPVQLKPIPIYHEKKVLLIDPYTLGMWLGDGHSSGSRMSCADPDILRHSKYKWHKVAGKYNYDTHGLQGLLNKGSLLKNKHIPHVYFISSYEQRLELLRGLMDTDGTCHCQGGIAYFSNTNYRLIKDIIALVRSLGGVAMEHKADMKVNGEEYDSWQVSIKLPNNINPFSLPRKVKQYTGLKRDLVISIVSIEPAEEDIANCITVEAKDGMFIADDYFPTHNSTLVTVGYSLQRICYDPSVRILIANATYKMAVAFLGEIKKHLTANEDLIGLYGDLAADPLKWSEDMITLKAAKTIHGKKEATVTAFGMGGNLVSQHYDLIILDDIVNRDMINTREQIEKTIMFYKDVLDLADSPKTEFLVIGTRWHDRDLYDWIINPDNRIIEGFNVQIRSAFEGSLQGEDFKALWPAKFTRSYLQELLRDKGPYEFHTQYMNNPVPDEAATFQGSWFKYYDETELKGRPLHKFVLIDPAISLEKEADYTAMVVIGVDHFGFWYVLDIFHDRVRPDRLISEIFYLDEKWHPMDIGIEDVAFQKTLQYSIQEEMRKRNRFLPIREVKPQTRTKDERIRGLQPLYANGRIYHKKELVYNEYLEDELLRYPRGRHDDIIDALSYAKDLVVTPKRKRDRGRSTVSYSPYV